MVVLDLLKKDLKILFRRKSPIIIPIVFSFVSVVVLSFFFQRGSYELMWIVLLFSSVFPQIEIMRYEFEEDVIESLVTSPLKSEVFFISKFLSGLIVILFISFFSLVFFVFFTNLELSIYLIVSIALSVWGMVSLSTLFSFFMFSSYMNLPTYYLIVFPFYIPLIVSAIRFVEGEYSALNLIVGFDLINFFAAFMLFDIRKP